MQLRDTTMTLDLARPDPGAGDTDVARLKALRDARVRALLAGRRPAGASRANGGESRR